VAVDAEPIGARSRVSSARACLKTWRRIVQQHVDTDTIIRPPNCANLPLMITFA